MPVKITTKIMGKETRLIPLREARQKLGVSRQAVLKLVNAGVLRGVREPGLPTLIVAIDVKRYRRYRKRR